MKIPSFLNIALLGFVISVFSLSFLSVGLQLNSSTQVLGESTQKANISCAEINQLFNQISLMHRKYCAVAPTIAPRPTTLPTSPQTCKTGLNSFSANRANCVEGFSIARFSCYDGFGGTVGDGTSCYSNEILKDMAAEKCAGRSSCVYPNPSLIPTYKPLPTTSYTTSFPQITRTIINSPPQRPIVTKYPIDPIYPIEPQPSQN